MNAPLRLHPYQQAAVVHLKAHDRAGLWLDMGLGKTASVLSALEERHLPALVTAPARVTRDVWPEEATKWRPDLRVVPVVGTPAQRAAAWATDADVYVISHQLLGEAARQPHGWGTFILDEASGFKNYRSKRWKAARLIAKTARCVWEMTGTPSPNGLLDLWAQIYLLDFGERLGRTITSYRRRYFREAGRLPSGVVTGYTPRPGASERIHALLEGVCLSMGTEGRLQLPPLTMNRIEVEMPASAKQAYKDMRTQLVADLSLLGGVRHTASTAAVATNRLSQISAGFLYDDDRDGWDWLHHAKLDALAEVIEGTGSPVLVFYRFQAELEMIQERFPESVHVSESGAVKHWNAGRIPILLAHPASAGHGLNLQHGGHTIVWTSLPWSLEQWQQANKRLQRQGQTHPVVVHVIESRGTLDSNILRVLDGKAGVQAALMEHLESLI